MLSRLDKLAPFLVMGLFAYLAHSVASETRVQTAQAKKPPVIGTKMLNPVLAEVRPGASPVDRDPFEVAWSSYLPPKEPTRKPTTRPATQPTTRPTTAPATKPTKPAEPAPPPMPSKFTAVITAQSFQIAIIDNDVYRPGALIGGTDPKKCWRVEAIERNRVTLRFRKLRCVLTISEEDSAGGASKGRR